MFSCFNIYLRNMVRIKAQLFCKRKDYSKLNQLISNIKEEDFDQLIKKKMI